MEPDRDDRPSADETPDGKTISKASIGYGIAFGMIAGVLVGVVTGAVGLWIAIGAALGAGLGMVVDVEAMFSRGSKK